MEAGGTEEVVFGLDRRGPAASVFVSCLAALFALAAALLAVRAAVVLVVDAAGPEEGGRAASLGFVGAFAASGYVAAEYAWRGRFALVAYRSPGSVAIRGDLLVILAPGLVTRPVELHRGWIEGADEGAVGWGSATALALDIVDRRGASAFIPGWAKQAPSTSPGEPPAPAAADAAPHRRRLVAWFVATASLASLLVTLPG